MVNPHLRNAARYIDAMYDVFVDENHPNLSSIIEKLVGELESPRLLDYWRAYQIEVSSELNIPPEANVEEEKKLYNRKISISNRRNQLKNIYHSEKISSIQGAGNIVEKREVVSRSQLMRES